MSTETQHTSLENSGRPRFYYDGNCGICRWAVNWLKRIDFSCRVSWVAFKSLEEPPSRLTWDDLDQTAYLETPDGTLYEGFYAFRKLSISMPLLLPLAPIFWFPGIQFPGRVVYRWVAANRYRLSRCGIPQRPQDSHVQAPAQLEDDS